MTNPQLLINIELIPVLELQPWLFSNPDREFPKESKAAQPAAWQHYWQAALADAGITELLPINSGSHYVAISAFNTELLIKVLRVIIEDWLEQEFLIELDTTPSLEGGVVLIEQGKTLIEPGCCADIATLNNWREVVDYRGAEWQMIYIGHPWIMARYQSPYLILSQPLETGEPKEIWLIEPARLSTAVSKAQSAIESLIEQLSSVLPKLSYTESPGSIAKRLVGY